MLNKFTIQQNQYLSRDIESFFHTHFYGATHPDNPNYLYKLKNDPHHNWKSYQLRSATEQLYRVVRDDLPQILFQLKTPLLTACVVPRAKADNSYHSDQLLFKSTVKKIINSLDGYNDGIDYIIRHTNTRTTHLRKPIDGFVNDGKLPYPGITLDTCHISSCVRGQDILLIDDIYTQTVNIDEDMIQALLHNGAKSVFFYAIGYTVKK